MHPNEATELERHAPLRLRRRPALLVAVALMIGLAAFKLIHPPDTDVWQWAPLACVFATLLLALLGSRLRTYAVIGGCIIAAFAFAQARFRLDVDDVSRVFPEGAPIVRLEGIVVQGTSSSNQDPAAGESEELGLGERGAAPQPALFSDTGSEHTSLLLELESELVQGTVLSGRIKLSVGEACRFRAGERVRALVALEPLPRPRNQGEFDLGALYWDHGIHMLAYAQSAQQVQSLGQTWHYPIQQCAEAVRDWTDQQLGSRMSPRMARFMRCLLLGDKSALSRDMRDDFVAAGSVHILVVSGLHVWALCFSIIFLCRFIGLDRRWRASIAAVAALGFLVLTGVEVATLRASLVVIFFAWAEWRGRPADFLNLLGLSAIVVLVREPGDLFSAGFVLSYLSVLALHLFMPIFEPRKTPAGMMMDERTRTNVVTGHIRNSVVGSAVVTGVTFPLVLGWWNLFAPVSFIVNLVIILPLILVLGSALLIPLAVFTPVAQVLAWWMESLLSLMDAIVRWAAQLPHGHMYMPALPLWWVVVFYAVLFGLACARWLPWKRVWMPVFLLGWCALVPWVMLRPDGSTRFSVLDVRQGACSVLETQNHVVMFDCGSQGRPHVGSWTIAPWLLARGHSRIDVLCLSHADADHVNGLATLMERVEVGELWVSESFEHTRAGKELLAWAGSRVRHVRRVSAGDVFDLEGVSIRILWPDPEFARHADRVTTLTNETSIVAQVEMDFAAVLVTGDAQDVAVTGMSLGLPRCDVLLAPHHGAEFGSAQALLARSRPQYVVASSRRGFIKPAVQTMYASAATLFTTYQSGTLSIEASGGGGYRIRTYVNSGPDDRVRVEE